MTRYILRSTGSSVGDGGDAGLSQHLRAMSEVTVLDESPRMLLVDAPRETLERALERFQGWQLVPETTTPLPDTRVKIGKR